MRQLAIKIARVLVDVAVIAACIASILHVARRREVDCAWHGARASCIVEVEDSLGRVDRDAVDGVRDLAYRSGSVVAFVTDPQHTSEHALFGTHEVEIGSPEDAARVAAFASDREPDHVSVTSGVMHPRWITGALLVALLAYGVVTRRKRANA